MNEIEQGISDLCDTVANLRDETAALTKRVAELESMFVKADKLIVWEAHGLGNTFSEAVDEIAMRNSATNIERN